jgi:Ca2+-transporting ATPase
MPTEIAPVTAPEPSHWHLRDGAELAREHGVDPEHGLLEHEVVQRALQHGPNALPHGEGRSVWALLLEQFSDFMILVLLAAALISGVVGDLVDTLVILAIVLLNAAIGLIQA